MRWLRRLFLPWYHREADKTTTHPAIILGHHTDVLIAAAQYEAVKVLVSALKGRPAPARLAERVLDRWPIQGAPRGRMQSAAMRGPMGME
jgi:hypothetical protein